MFHSRGLNNKTNSLHERALRITYGDRSSLFEDLLKKDNSISIHHRNIQALATEIFKVKNNIATEISEEFFAPKISHYGLRNNNSFKSRRVNSVWHDIELVSYLGQKIWGLVPNETNESESLNGFKFKIKRWVPEGCTCRICNIYLAASRVYNNIKKQLDFSEIKLCVIIKKQLDFSEIKLCVITIVFAYKSLRLKLCVAINYCVLFLIESS